MPNPRSDSNDYGANSGGQERDLGAKGGPTTGLGSPDDKHGISRPYDEDIQTQLAAKNKSKKKKKAKKS